MSKYVLGLDVGGSSLKSALVDPTGLVMKNSFDKTLLNNKDTAENILRQICRAISAQLEKVGLQQVSGLGIGMPGPFDYIRGISKMKHKFAALYGVNLDYEIRKRLELLDDFTIRFGPDSWCFLRGESWLGAAQSCNRTIGITLGTGLGSAFMAEGQLVKDGPGVPPYAWIGALPYNGGTVEDKVSQRWLVTRYKELSGQSLEVKEIAERALLNKDKNSLRVFNELGRTLGEVLTPIAYKFNAECIIFGGEISKSFELFSAPILDALLKVPSVKNVTKATYIELSPIRGSAQMVFLGSSYTPPNLGFDKAGEY